MLFARLNASIISPLVYKFSQGASYKCRPVFSINTNLTLDNIKHLITLLSVKSVSDFFFTSLQYI